MIPLVMVYRIRCLPTGRVYVGSTTRGAQRWIEHRCDLNKNVHHSRKLQRAWNKYGSKSFAFEVLQELASEKGILAVEQAWMYKLCPALNVSKKAGKFNWCSAQRKAASERMKRYWTPERRAALAKRMENNRYSLGVKHSEESKRARSEQLKSNNPMKTEAMRSKMSKAMLGNRLGSMITDAERQAKSRHFKSLWANHEHRATQTARLRALGESRRKS